MAQRRAGIIQVQFNGEIMDAKGSWSYDLGVPKREAIMGADRMHGYKETPTVAYIEGEITDRGTLNLKVLASITEATITLSLANGKTVVLRDGFAAGDWKGNTDEGNISCRFEGASAEEIQP